MTGFPFQIHQFVTVCLFKLNYPGRIQSITISEGPVVYTVQYARDGELHTGSFYEDEICDAVP